ncbi:MAG: acyl carrier protein [Anaerolineae bacterium]|nr:acyl carrier protein [Gloeobacterales cyanobacterium ES-bin-313]
MSTISSQSSATSILEWLTVKLSERLKVSIEEIDPEETFSGHGLSSAQALILMAQLEERFSLRLSPTLFWNYPTPLSFCHRIAEEVPAPLQTKSEQGGSRWTR